MTHNPRTSQLASEYYRLPKFDRDIIMYAFRYAVQRSSYAVGVMADKLVEVWAQLEPFDRQKIKDEIDEEWGNMPSDIQEQWAKVMRLPL